jgi:hypothetical protein
MVFRRKRRYFELRSDSHDLHYYEDHLSMNQLGTVRLDKETVATLAGPDESGQ